MATVASLERNAQLRIRDLICEDPIALEKWARVVDDVVSSAVDVRRIKDGLNGGHYEEAILRTLQLCSCDLVGVLRRHRLNSVADKIATIHSGCNYSLNHIWYDVVELPHDFSGRDSELETTHQRLSHYLNWSVDANIVCISGPAGVGKSTLARRYAFKNCDFYGGNVLWIDAQSTESMRASFTKLATTKLRLPAVEDNQTLAKDVYDFFKDRKCLFVFDGLQRMENFNQFRPKIISPLYSTPYLLVTSRKGGLAPVRENELRILHYILAVLKNIEEMSKPAAELAKLISYLDPGKVTIGFLEEMFEQFKTSRLDFQSCFCLLEKHKLVQVRDSRVVIEPRVQEVIKSSLSKVEEASSLRTIRKTHQHLLKKRKKDLMDEGTAHRLHLLLFDLKSASMFEYFNWLWWDLSDYSGHSLRLEISLHTYNIIQDWLPEEDVGIIHVGFRIELDPYLMVHYQEALGILESLLKISLQAYEMFKDRFGDEDGSTIQVRFRIACAHYSRRNFPEAIGILESLLPVAKATLGRGHLTTGKILSLLAVVYSNSRDIVRACEYQKEWEAWKEMQEKKTCIIL